MTGKKVMLLGIAVILLGIACSTSATITIMNGITRFFHNYAHWIGIVIVGIGLFSPDSENK